MDTYVRIFPGSTSHSTIVGTIDLILRCGYCRDELTQSQMFEFRGWVACEKCIRDYYRDHPNEVESELQTRRKNALIWLSRNRKSLQKLAVKK
jgi:hypothetical protein